MAAFKDYEAMTGAKLELTEFPNPFETNVLTRWAAGERPDILFFHGAGNWLVQLNPTKTLIPLDNEPFVGRTIPGILEATTKFGDSIYGAVLRPPLSYGVYYNKKFFADNGLVAPTTGGYDALLSLCEQIKAKDPNIAPIFMGGGDQWPTQPLVVGLWGDDITPDVARGLNDRSVTFTDPRFVQWIAKLKELQDKGCLNKDVLTATFEDEQSALFDGRGAMIYQGSWFLDAIQGASGPEKVAAEIEWFPLSGKGTTVSWEIPGGQVIYLPKTGDATKEALATGFTNWLGGGDGYAKFLAATLDYPVFTGFPDPADPLAIRVKIRDAYLKWGMPIFQQVLQAAYGPMESFFQSVVAGTMTPEQAAQSLQDEYDKSAKQVGLPGF